MKKYGFTQMFKFTGLSSLWHSLSSLWGHVGPSWQNSGSLSRVGPFDTCLCNMTSTSTVPVHANCGCLRSGPPQPQCSACQLWLPQEWAMGQLRWAPSSHTSSPFSSPDLFWNASCALLWTHPVTFIRTQHATLFLGPLFIYCLPDNNCFLVSGWGKICSQSYTFGSWG